MLPSPKQRIHPTELESAARIAFAKHVTVYHGDDEIIVRVEKDHLRLVYVSVRASRRAGSATMIQCRLEHARNELWVNSLQVNQTLRRQGFGRELAEAAEATAGAIGLGSIRVYPITNAVGFWKSLGYRSDPRMARVLRKDLTKTNCEELR